MERVRMAACLLQAGARSSVNLDEWYCILSARYSAMICVLRIASSSSHSNSILVVILGLFAQNRACHVPGGFLPFAGTEPGFPRGVSRCMKLGLAVP